MTDPISGQMAAQTIQQTQATQGAEGKAGGPAGASFQEVMNKQEAAAAEQSAKVEKAAEIEPTQKPEKARMDDFVKGVMGDEKELNAMMERCMNGGSMDQGEMLQMQALMYSYSQKVDLATKVVDKATSGVKQVMNTQV